MAANGPSASGNAGEGVKRGISSRLAAMSFMQRGVERELRDSLAKRQRTSALPPAAPKPKPTHDSDNPDHWMLPAPELLPSAADEPLVVLESGTVFEANPGTFGRQSYGKFNPELERRNKAIANGLDPDAPVRPVVPDSRAHAEPTTKDEDIEVIEIDDDVEVVEGKVEQMSIKNNKRTLQAGAGVSGNTSGKNRHAKPYKRSPGGNVDEAALKKKRRKRNRNN